MKKLLNYLSPFAPDQSGACGVLYELGGIIVICDAGGCTGNICGFDEPRWFTKKSAVFSAGLRDMDAIMGRDDKLIAKLGDAHDRLKTPFTALVATPVPAVIGTDMKALKRMAEKRTGVPCIAINAIGTKYYDEGEAEAWYQLFREFTTGTEEDRAGVGIIGATPLETGYADAAPLIEACHEYGIDEPVIYSMGTGLEEVRRASGVKYNLVVSAAGIRAAEYLKSEFGIPYETGYPFIPSDVIEECIKSFETKSHNRNVLIIHSQFAANELRNIIFHNLATMGVEAEETKVSCSTFFMMNDKYAEEGDFRLSGEDELAEIASENRYDTIIGDGDLERLLKAYGFRGEFIEFPSFAISGKPLGDGRTLYN